MNSKQAITLSLRPIWPAANGHREGVVSESGLGALMHTLLALKQLPHSEREAWKRLFDHYLFDDHDPAANIPVERRNLLGPLTPPLVEQIKRKIRSYL